MDYNRLSGPQRKVLREMLMKLFRDGNALDMFADGEPGEYLVLSHYDGGYPEQLYRWIADSGAQGRLQPFVVALKAAFPNSPHLQDIDAKLALFSNTAEEESGARAMGGLERIASRGRFGNPLPWATEFVARTAAVCQVRVRSDLHAEYGSGFLIAPDTVLTAYHVVEEALGRTGGLADVTCTFGFAEEADGLNTGTTKAIAAIPVSSPYAPGDLVVGGAAPAPSELDFAVLKLPSGSTHGWPSLAPGTFAKAPKSGATVVILQHPMNQPVKHTFGRVVAESTSLRLRYDANTLQGSSGGLVMTEDLEPIALHHAGDPDRKIKAQFNQGIPLPLIAEAIKTSGVMV